MIHILGAALLLALFFYFKWKVQAMVLAAWIAEKGIAPPEPQDVKRLSEWVVQRMISKK